MSGAGAAPAADPGAGRAGAIAAAVRRLPVVLWLLLALGIALRLELWRAYSPTVLNLADAGDYVYMAQTELFGDPTSTVGYPIFLRAAHGVSSQIEFTIALQHLLGIATALVLYATARRLRAPVWVGVVAAATVLLCLDQIFLEHALMNETLFTLLFVVALYAAVRALEASRPLARRFESRHAWIAAAAAALALAGWVRPVAVPLLPALALWFALAIEGPWRARLLNAGLATAVAAVVIVSYFALHAAETGYFGLSRTSGWALYSRTAPFADCSRFDPPAGTRALCETTPAEQRSGPDFYGYQPGSPARRLFGEPPEGDDQLGAFARRALFAQPLSYLSAVGRDMVRYFHPAFAPQDFSGVGLELLDVDRRAPGFEEIIAERINGYYADDDYSIDAGAETLGRLQDVLRLHPKLLLVCTLLGGLGVFVARDRLRWGLVLLLGGSLGLMIVAPATAIWSARYAIPAQGPIVLAAAIGAWLAATRLLREAE